jgi:hypothetical protein
MPINGGMMPWDYYQASIKNARRNAVLAERMEQLRTAQIRQQMLAQRGGQSLPLRMSLMPGRSPAAVVLPGLPQQVPASPPRASALMQHAQEAIGQGANAAAVIGRLQSLQVDPSPLIAQILTAVPHNSAFEDLDIEDADGSDASSAQPDQGS